MCIFCDILADRSPASFVHRDELCAAFMDIRPINPGHVLVVPRQHAVSLLQLEPIAAGRLLQVAQRVDAALRQSGLRCEGVNLYLADGRVAGQEVLHVHLHVIPRFSGDGFHLQRGPGIFQPHSASELEVNASLIRQQMGAA